MTVETLIFCCEGDSGARHGRIELAPIARLDDGSLEPVIVVQMGGRPKPGSWHHSPFGQRELAADPDRYAEDRPIATPIREDHQGRIRWRLPACPRCGYRLPPKSDDSMRRIVSQALAAGRRVLPVRAVPR